MITLEDLIHAGFFRFWHFVIIYFIVVLLIIFYYKKEQLHEKLNTMISSLSNKDPGLFYGGGIGLIFLPTYFYRNLTIGTNKFLLILGLLLYVSSLCFFGSWLRYLANSTEEDYYENKIFTFTQHPLMDIFILAVVSLFLLFLQYYILFLWCYMIPQIFFGLENEYRIQWQKKYYVLTERFKEVPVTIFSPSNLNRFLNRK